MFYLARRLAWDVASLETDLVRRPRVRGTAPQATVGTERRLSLILSNSAADRSASVVGLTEGESSVMDGLNHRSVYLVDPASSHMLVSKIKPCKCQHMPPNG